MQAAALHQASRGLSSGAHVWLVRNTCDHVHTRIFKAFRLRLLSQQEEEALVASDSGGQRIHGCQTEDEKSKL